MLLESLKYSKNNFHSFFKANQIIFYVFVALTISFDIIKLSVGQGHGNVDFVVGILEVLATYYFYATLILSSFSTISETTQKKLGVNFFIYLRVNIVYSLLFLVGSVLVIPGLWVLVFLFFAPIITLDETYKDSKYLKRSIEIVKKSPFSVLGLSLISLIIMSIDFVVFPYIKESEYKLSFMILKNVSVTLFDMLFLVAVTKMYSKLSKS